MNDIVVGVDQSATARLAAEKAAELAAAYGANLHIVYCVPRSTSTVVGAGGDQWFVSPTAEAETFLNALALELRHDPITTRVSHDEPAEAICAEAERIGARTIVVGNRRVQGMARVLGSIAGDVLKHAPCDVLVANTIGA
ncbi:MAG TPA: universal stress protein [Ilumatobacter sp.]